MNADLPTVEETIAARLLDGVADLERMGLLRPAIIGGLELALKRLREQAPSVN